MTGYEILRLTNGALYVESSSTPMNTNLVPRASVLSEVFMYPILAVVETYCPGINSYRVDRGLGCCHESEPVTFGSGYSLLKVRTLLSPMQPVELMSNHSPLTILIAYSCIPERLVLACNRGYNFLISPKLKYWTTIVL
jgi:hypothetical protein